jgi:hypothetical protein
MEIDWRSPIGGTRDLLACVPGLTEPAFKQWRVRGVIRLTAADMGTGHPATYQARDVLQVAMVHELSRETALIAKAPRIWLLVQRAMARRQFPAGEARNDEAILLTISPDGALRDWSFRESQPVAFARALAAPGSPTTMTVLRVDKLIDDVAARIAALEPIPA